MQFSGFIVGLTANGCGRKWVLKHMRDTYTHTHTHTHTHTWWLHATSVLASPWRMPNVTAVGTVIFWGLNQDKQESFSHEPFSRALAADE